MADFRKWILAFAVVALLSSLAVPASAQTVNQPPPAFSCSQGGGTGAVTPTIRTEGLTELVGDFLLTCTGGSQTPIGSLIPKANITVFTSQNITSRILTTGVNPFTEALLIIDEPHSSLNPTVPLRACSDDITYNTLTQTCDLVGVGAGSTPYNGTSTHPNVYQGRTGVQGTGAASFLGVPIDPPGTGTARTFRITNIRVDAPQVSSTIIPAPVTMFISITGSTALPVINASQTVAFVQVGMVFTTTTAVSNIFQQCLSANPNRFTSATGGLGTSFQGATQFGLRITEGFATAWKRRIAIRPTSPATAGSAQANQNIPGAIYNTESGFVNTTGAALDPGEGASPLPNPQPTAFGATNNLVFAGIADRATRVIFQFRNVPTTVSIDLPQTAIMYNVNIGAAADTGGRWDFVQSDATGNQFIGLPSGSFGTATVHLLPTNNALSATYEVRTIPPSGVDTRNSDNTIERSDFPVIVSFVSDVGNSNPTVGLDTRVSASFAPLSTRNTASDFGDPIPRFRPSANERSLFTIVRCQCDILFPFVTNQGGFDTGIAISNTSADPFGTTPQTGTLTLNFYGATAGGGAAPGPATTATPIPGGGQFIFQLSSGTGNFGLPTVASAGFQGYIIAVMNFQYCHAFAFISDSGAQKVAEGYLGIILDVPGLNRTFQLGENEGH